MNDSISPILYELQHGPSPPPKKIIQEWKHGEVRIIKPADPEKLKAYRATKKTIKKRRLDAGLEETNNTVWSTR